MMALSLEQELIELIAPGCVAFFARIATCRMRLREEKICW
jgi:hypothetical protein